MKPYDYVNRKIPDAGWQARHLAAIHSPNDREEPIVNLLKAWCDYASQHTLTHGSPIGKDGFLGEPWARIGGSLLRLLNGDCGELDCGTIDGIIRDNLEEQGFEPEDY